jgi:DNA/RNA endonuclease YhcR with UshA esterase domain
MPAIGLLAVAIFALYADGAPAGSSITPAEAEHHVGESATVCGVVASAHYAPTTKAQPTFLNLDQPYPNQIFTAVIFGRDRPKFGEPEAMQGKSICVTGKIELYRGKPEIIVHNVDQIMTR